MTEAEKPTAKKPPRGGRKGGRGYPKVKLGQAIAYAKKLVGKTHTGPMPASTILPGVFGNAGPIGKVRASALKQYGLLLGTSAAYKASPLAKDIEAAPDAETSRPLLHLAFRNSKLFSEILDTFQGDTVSKGKIEQRAKGLEVHPESAQECAQIFMDSAVFAGMGTVAGDSISLNMSEVKAALQLPGDEGTDDSDTDDNGGESEEPADTEVAGEQDPTVKDGAGGPAAKSGQKANVNLNLTVDSTTDPEKLEKQLRLLRQFGML
jgi:hypothetical protein